MSMRSRERRALLLEALSVGEIDVDDVAARLKVSASTVRRDLQHLSATRAVRRTYGGAILTRHPPETTLTERLAVNGAEKRAIARAALDLVADGDTLILDAGSTVAAFGQLLAKRRLRIITNNLALLPFLADNRIHVVPPCVVTDDEAGTALAIYDDALTLLTKELS